MDITEAQGLFEPGCVYLNTASYGLPPRTSFERLAEVLDDWRAGRTSWEPWGEAAESCRASFARLIGARAEDVAIGATVSQQLALVAGSLEPGEVLVPELEFTSDTFPFLAAPGLDVRAVPLARLAEEVRPETRAVAFSVVQSATGELADLAAIGAAARAAGALTVADVTQALGWLPFRAGELDFVVCHTYKWLLSPRGASLLYVAPARREELLPAQAGWYAAEDVHGSYYGTAMELAASARRFDLSPAWFCWVGAEPSLALIEEVGVEAIQAHDVGLANRFRAGLGLPPGDSAIVSVELPGASEALARANVRAAARAGALRVSFHLYNSESDVDDALAALTG